MDGVDNVDVSPLREDSLSADFASIAVNPRTATLV